MPTNLDIDDEISRLAPSRATVLIVGGTPEMKVGLARALHERSPRAVQPFVAVDCTAFASEVLEDVLFGGPLYSARVASDPPLERRGAVNDAQRGTLYVANVDALPMTLQARFLRFLDVSYTLRVVASSDTDLVALARPGRFRADLAERLSLVRVVLSEQEKR